jgi:hypothetical protein
MKPIGARSSDILRLDLFIEPPLGLVGGVIGVMGLGWSLRQSKAE